MANTDAPFGFRPVRHLDGSAWNGATERFQIPSSDSTAVFIGDAVKSAGSADTDGIRTVAQAAATDTILGVVVSFDADQTDLTKQYRVASTERYVNVVTSPDVVYEVQEDSVGGALAQADVGLNADITVGTGSTTTGMSAMELDSSDKKSGSAQLRILGLAQREGNAIGNQANWEVLINEHEYKTTSGT